MRTRAICGAILIWGFTGDIAAAQQGNPGGCVPLRGFLGRLGVCSEQGAPGNGPAGNSGAVAGNLSDQFFTNPTQAMATYSTFQRATIRFERIELNQGDYQVSFHELPNAVRQQNDRQIAGGGMNNFFALSQGPNQFNSTYTIYCFFPPADGNGLATIRIGEAREVSVQIKETRPQTLIFRCRL